MDEDVIVVDDYEASQPSYASGSTHRVLSSQAETQASGEGNPASSSSMTSRLRTRSSSNPISYNLDSPSSGMDGVASSSNERTTRSSAGRPRHQPKLKLKLSEKAAAMAPGTSFLGTYDRELDSDDEDLSFEEQFILRLPPGEDLEKLRKMVAAREVTNDVWFKFKGRYFVVQSVETYSQHGL